MTRTCRVVPVVALIVALLGATILAGATVAATTADAGAATTTTLPPKGKGLVHVTVTGSRKLVLDGTAVSCEPGGGTTNVGLDGADYTQLGRGGYLVVLVPQTSQFTPAVRARITGKKYSTLGAQERATWKVSGRKVTFSRVYADGGANGIRVSGAVVCP